MTDTPAGASRTAPLLLMIIGGAVLAYGQVILAPLAPSAAWTGVLDSATPGPGPGRSFPLSDASRTVTLHLHGQASGRTFSVPTGATVAPQSLAGGDTVHVLVGWGTLRDLPAAINLTAGSKTVVDSAIVLREQRTQGSRVSLAGGLLLAVGLGWMVRSRRQANS
ncbi:MAG TPA: hypothetical protein VLD58_11890 [Gemmatimonadales bacterium]|nr:hypothetical protein [Gemmatimonadales bacterium]